MEDFSVTAAKKKINGFCSSWLSLPPSFLVTSNWEKPCRDNLSKKSVSKFRVVVQTIQTDRPICIILSCSGDLRYVAIYEKNLRLFFFSLRANLLHLLATISRPQVCELIDHYWKSNPDIYFECSEPPFLFLCYVFTFKIFAYSPERPYCIHCHQFQSLDIYQLLDHCKSCVAMSRPNPYRHKFVCYACSYSTYLSGNIKKHVYTHLGEKPFACTICEFKAVANNKLRIHIDRYHKDNLVML